MADNDYQTVLNRMAGNADVMTKKYYDSLAIEMRLVDSDLSNISFDFFGTKLPMPIMMGVIGGFSHLGEDANYKATLAAKELDTIYWTSSHVSDEELKRMIASGAKVGIVIKPFKDQEYFLQRCLQAQEAGVVAIACDIDHAYNKNGGYDGQRDNVFGPKTSEELKQTVETLKVPFIAKGVLSVQDALKCKEAGVSGIILSHHHNIMSFAVPPAMILPEIRKTVGEDYPVFVDCGIVSAAEAFKALALGANGVLVARAYMAPLAKEGTQGVVDFFNKMKGELREFLNRTGSKDLKHIDPSVIHQIP
ncbi:MAG: alpha-hydroxy-acid oxidizing protein [Erysipelotrichaceae bacterium]|nr:alpha-hydroxy-acid oxidizing protein [Erysipelotrichaceae bacterium]